MHLSDTSANRVAYREQLMGKYGFDYEQAVAITEMRSLAFTVQEREKTKEELVDLMRM